MKPLLIHPISLSMALCVCGVSLVATSGTLDADQGTSSAEKTAPKMNTPINLTPTEAEHLLTASHEVIVVDVRTQEEFAEGHIAGARNVNFNSPQFAEKMKEFAGKKVLLHCASGGRSSRAIAALPANAFEKLYHLEKGFNAWQSEGKPVSTK